MISIVSKAFDRSTTGFLNKIKLEKDGKKLFPVYELVKQIIKMTFRIPQNSLCASNPGASMQN